MEAHTSTVRPDVSSHGRATFDAAGNSIRKSQLGQNLFDFQQGASQHLLTQLNHLYQRD